jgi:hypothetical protein
VCLQILPIVDSNAHGTTATWWYGTCRSGTLGVKLSLRRGGGGTGKNVENHVQKKYRVDFIQDT